MMLTLTSVFRKPKETQYGLKTSIGIKATEYGDRWINGWGDEINATWQKGQVVEATVEQKGDYLNFKAIRPSASPNQPVANTIMKGKLEDDKWDKISWGKCKHAYLVEAFKQTNIYGDETLDFGKIERNAEMWADMSMRKLSDTEPKKFDFSKVPNEPNYDDEYIDVPDDEPPF